MAWDSTRPVPWKRLLREWLLYGGLMAVVVFFFLRDDLSIGPFLGLAASAPLYLVIGGVLAKFGYQRKTLKDLRAETAAKEAARATARSGTAGGSNRSRPAPTRRTSTGPSNRPNRSRPKGKRR